MSRLKEADSIILRWPDVWWKPSFVHCQSSDFYKNNAIKHNQLLSIHVIKYNCLYLLKSPGEKEMILKYIYPSYAKPREVSQNPPLIHSDGHKCDCNLWRCIRSWSLVSGSLVQCIQRQRATHLSNNQPSYGFLCHITCTQSQTMQLIQKQPHYVTKQAMVKWGVTEFPMQLVYFHGISGNIIIIAKVNDISDNFKCDCIMIFPPLYKTMFSCIWNSLMPG